MGPLVLSFSDPVPDVGAVNLYAFASWDLEQRRGAEFCGPLDDSAAALPLLMIRCIEVIKSLHAALTGTSSSTKRGGISMTVRKRIDVCGRMSEPSS